MEANFNAEINRRGTNSVKWDLPVSGLESHGQKDVLPMWVADMDFPVPEVVQRALSERVDHPVYGYSLLGDDLRDAYVQWQNRRNGWEVDPDWLVYAPGVMPAIRSAILALTEPGDEIIVQPPVYYPFYHAVEENGRQLLLNPLVERHSQDGVASLTYEMDLDHLQSVITRRTRMLLLCSPHNPVGRVWTRRELDELAGICERNNVIVISDEIHSDLIRDGRGFAPFADRSDEMPRMSLTCVSPTKTFNIAGLASSFVIVPDGKLRRRVKMGLAHLSMNLPNVLSITAAAAAYRDGEPWLDELLSYLNGTFTWFEEEMAKRFADLRMSALEGTYLAWLDMRRLLEHSGVNDATLKKTLLETGGLWLSDGPQFGEGGSGFQRMNLACPRSTIQEGLDRLHRAVEALS